MKYKESIPILEEAIRLDPNNADIHHTLGLTYIKIKHYQKAITHLEKALSIKPNFTKSDPKNVANSWLS